MLKKDAKKTSSFNPRKKANASDGLDVARSRKKCRSKNSVDILGTTK